MRDDINITIDERILIAICDAALKQQGVQMIQAVNVVLNEIQKAKQGGINGSGPRRPEAHATQ